MKLMARAAAVAAAVVGLWLILSDREPDIRRVPVPACAETGECVYDHERRVYTR